jgi:hypothetical protein
VRGDERAQPYTESSSYRRGRTQRRVAASQHSTTTTWDESFRAYPLELASSGSGGCGRRRGVSTLVPVLFAR